MSLYDLVIIGAGHNGLVCAGYLSRLGLKVRVVEKRHIVGGAAVTEEFFDGYSNSVCSYVVSMLSPSVINGLELEKFGLDLIKRESGMFSALPNGRHLIISDDEEETHREISKFSRKDADIHPEFIKELNQVATLFRGLAESKMPNFSGGILDLWNGLKFGNKIRKLLNPEQFEKISNIMTMSIGDYLDNWFESDEVKGYYVGDGSMGNFVHPYSAGSAYILLHHAFGMINGELGSWWHAKGGMGSITQAMAKSAEFHGAEISVNSAVKEIIISDNKASGVILESGEEVKAKMVAANCTPYILFNNLLNNEDLPSRFANRMKKWRSRSGSFRMNIALSELPKVTSLVGVDESDEILKRAINISPSIQYMEKAYHDARVSGMARSPFISMNILSLIDDSLAPTGKHVASLFCQHFNPALPDNLDWDIIKDEAADIVIETINEIAPNFRESIIGMQVLSPKDLETEFSLTGGDIFHGSLHLDQLFSSRPAAGYADYRTPIENLYICGSGSHPGGGVSGIPGRLSSVEIYKDFKKLK